MEVGRMVEGDLGGEESCVWRDLIRGSGDFI